MHFFPSNSPYTIFGHGGLAREAQACAYLCFTLLQSFWNDEGPRKLCGLHAPHGLTSTKQSQPSERETRAPSLSNQVGSAKGVFPPHFLVVCKSYLDFFGHRNSVYPGRAAAHFCPAELCSDLMLCCGFLLCRQDAMFQSSSHFITERHCERLNSLDGSVVFLYNWSF